MTILHGNDAFSILVFSTKKGYSSFFKKTFRFSKICFKVKVLKTFKTFTDCHMKICHLSKGGLFWKSLVPFFRKTYTLSVGFEKKPPRKSIFQCLNKNQPNFCSKTCWKEQPFIFTVYLMNHVFPATVLTKRDNRMHIRLRWFCKHIKEIRSSQPTDRVLNWIKHNLSLWVSLIKLPQQMNDRVDINNKPRKFGFGISFND